MLNTGPLAEQFPTSPYPRLQRLREELRDAELVADGEDWVFRQPSGAEVRLTDLA